MTSTKRMLQKLAVGGAFCLALMATTAIDAQTPSGSIIFMTVPGSTGMQTMWTGCKVLFKGKTSECSISGLTVPIAGTATVAGTIFDMKDIGELCRDL